MNDVKSGKQLPLGVHIAVRFLLFVLVFAAGFVLGDQSWKRLQVFPPIVFKPQPPLPHDIHHFRTSQIPAFSSDHYYFREGHTDVNEYWSFCLPPERAAAFLIDYIATTKLQPVKDTSQIPTWVNESQSAKWDQRYWFGDFEELDQIFYEKYLFCGYSAKHNRVYLMNWND